MTQKLFPFRKVILVLTALFALVIVYSFAYLPPKEQNSISLPSFLAMLWLVLCYLLVHFSQKFAEQSAHHLTSHSANRKGLFTRIKLKVQRVLYYLSAVIFLLLTLAIVLLTIRLLNAWL